MIDNTDLPTPRDDRALASDVIPNPPSGMRRWVPSAVVLVLVAVAAWSAATWRARKVAHDGSAASSQAVAGTTDTAGMQGMAGMEGMGGMPGMPGKDASNNGSVVFTADQIRQFGVTFGTAEMRPLTSETRTTGTVTFDERTMTQVALKFGGYVERLHVNATGQPVERGQPMLDIYAPDLVATQEELLNSVALQREIGASAVPGVTGTTLDLVDATKRRLRLWDISDAQVDELLRTGNVRRTLTVYSPSTGIVVEKRVVQGQALVPGEQIFAIADLSHVWVDVQLREADAAAVRPGSGATMEFAGLEGREFGGRVEYVYPTLQEEARAVRARVVVANASGLLKPGMYATVRLTTPARTALTVPNSAVLRTGDRNVVFVDMGSGALMPHEVELGRAASAYTEVIAGLKAGQRVVTSAQFLIDSESNLAEVMKAMVGQMSTGDLSKSQSMTDMPGMKMPPDEQR